MFGPDCCPVPDRMEFAFQLGVSCCGCGCRIPANEDAEMADGADCADVLDAGGCICEACCDGVGSKCNSSRFRNVDACS